MIERLRGIIESRSGAQFEIESGDRCLRLAATAFGDMLSHGVRRHRAEAARTLLPPAVRQQSDADVGVRR
jgi:hypothetical protein